MFKKRIVVLIIFLLMTISSVCFAGDRWLTVQEDSEGIFSFDTNRIILCGDSKDTYLDCWIKSNTLKDDITFLEHTYIKIPSLNYKIAELTIYRGDKYWTSRDRSNEGWKSPVPESRQETAIVGIIHWASDNKEKITILNNN